VTALPSGATACANHPRREAIGICVRCRTQVCGECTTKVDGINYCVSCLAALAGPKREKREVAKTSSPLVAAFWLVVGTSALTLATWAMLELGAIW
jgi:hypothetical protein